jgi:hypothetical protein
MLPAVLALALANLSAYEQSEAAKLFDTTALEQCATADRTAARACIDKVLRPETRTRLLATPFDQIHTLGTPLTGVVYLLTKIWPEDLKASMAAKVKADGYLLDGDEPIFIAVQDYWLEQNHCDLDQAARVEDDHKAGEELGQAIRKQVEYARAHPSRGPTLTQFTAPHHFKPRCARRAAGES